VSSAQLAHEAYRPDNAVAGDLQRTTSPTPSFCGRDGRTDFSPEVKRLIEGIRDAVELEGAGVAATQLVSLLRSQAAPPPVSARGGLAPWQRRKLDSYFGEHFARPIRLEELADQVCLSLSHFCRAFKGTFGDTPHEYLIRLRLQQAERLMLATNKPLSLIALACGFADQGHFCWRFRRATGETPSAWRRRRAFPIGEPGEQLSPTMG
jgi:AraC family transcriptional regulator